METERRHNVHSRPALPAIQKMCGLGEIIAGIKTPLDLSIAKARGTWRIFEVKYLQYILFRRRSAEASPIERETCGWTRGGLVFHSLARMANRNSIANSARSTYDHYVR